MKSSNDGISKTWTVEKSHLPFYSGGKIEIFNQENDLMTLYQNKTIKIIDISNGNIKYDINDDIDDVNDNITCFCINPNNKEFVLSTQRGLLKHWDIISNKCIRTIKGHNMPITTMSYDSTGTLVATGSTDRSVRVWDITKGHCTHKFNEHADIIRLVQFHSNSSITNTTSTLYSTSDDNTIKIWDLITSACIATFNDHISSPKAIGFSPDGYMLLSTGLDKVINFYELRDYSLIKLFPVMEEIHGLIVLSNEHSNSLLGENSLKIGDMQFVIVVSGERGLLRLFKIFIHGKNKTTFTCEPIYQLVVTEPIAINNADISNDSNTLRCINSLLYLPLRNEIIAVTSDHNFYCYNINTSSKDEPLVKSRQMVGYNDDILDIIWIPNNDINEDDNNTNQFNIAVITNSCQIKLINESFDTTLLDGHIDIVLAADVTPDGKYLLTCSKDKTCRIWDLTTLSNIAIGSGHTDSICSIVSSQKLSNYQSNNGFMVTGGVDKIIKKWPMSYKQLTSAVDRIQLKPSISIHAHDKDINTLAVSPNDLIIASGSQDKLIKLYNSSDLSLISTLKGHKRSIWKVLFSPIERKLVSCSGDRTIKIWSLVDYLCLQTLEGHTSSILNIKFINFGTQLISSTIDGLIYNWLIKSNECINIYDSHKDRIWALCTPNNNHKFKDMFISGSSDSIINIWKDITISEELKNIQLIEQNLIIEQELVNDIKNKRYTKALKAALSIDHSFKVLNILTSILLDSNESIESIDYNNPSIYLLTNNITNNSADNNSNNYINDRLDKHLRDLTINEVNKIVVYIKEWNSNSKYCYVCQLVIHSLLTIIPLDQLVNNKGMNDSIDLLISYSNKHYERINRLSQASYLLDYLSSMISLLPNDSTSHQIFTSNVITNKKIDDTEDDFIPVLFNNITSDIDANTDNEIHNNELIITKKRKSTSTNKIKKKKFLPIN